MDETPPDATQKKSNGKVLDYKEGKAKKQRAETGPVKLKPAEVHANLAEAICYAKTSVLPDFPIRLGVISLLLLVLSAIFGPNGRI